MTDTEPDPPRSGADAPEPGADDHDPTGLNLARNVARSIGAQSRRMRRRSAGKPRPEPAEPQSSGARPDDRDPQLLGRAIERLVDSRGWTTEVSVHLLLSKWPALVGPTNAQHTQPESYVDTVLTVRADSTAWATSLRSMAPQLVATLNQQLGDGTVTRIRVLGPDAPSWKHGRRSVRGRGPRDTYG
ncbi:DciA family protein [Microlunatus parietis]|uniref:Putative nucleic acid-binding Zn ribbon protein n=1 Tax=Microlunatus parietis TaxID=682979 RepID=A0A7Y9LBY5_9ACTN|nr:DciA family protein [Microlunatus parietis]NYE72242.1 putative nucleic acid-binding Zn ribbon protein [Microlunatus parietis]